MFALSADYIIKLRHQINMPWRKDKYELFAIERKAEVKNIICSLHYFAEINHTASIEYLAS